MAYFFSADHHFYHKNIIEYSNRPFDSVDHMNAELISRHNEVVTDNDIVVIAGDFSFANLEKTQALMESLHGRLIFLRGSHDYWMDKADQHYHEIWEKTIQKQKVVVCHYAMRTWPCSHYDSWQLYGHSHGQLHLMKNQMDIGVDTNNFYPYHWNDIKSILA